MEPLILERTKITPNIILDKNNGVFKIVGRSIPENSVGYYEPIISWLEKYIESPNESTVLQFDTEYFNTASSKIFLQIIQLFETPVANGSDVKIHWIYDEADEDCLEAGQAYESLVKVPFVYISR
jgi:hypothetical protein